MVDKFFCMDTILIIEDDQILLESIAEQLDDEGFKVITAGNGEEGAIKAAQSLPDLILCDIYMPRLNGYQTFERIKENLATSLIPFIFLTAKTETEDIMLGMKMGADDYITKPIDFEELVERINKRLNKTRETIKRSEIRYHAIFESAHDAILLIRLSDFRIIDANQAACQLLRQPRETLLGSNGKSIATFPDEKELLSRQIKGGSTLKSLFKDVETSWKKKDGEEVDVLVSGQVIQILSEPMLYLIARNLSEIKAKEYALKESEAINRNLIENIGEGIGVVDTKEVFQFANPAAEQIFGVGNGELVGKNLDEFLPDPSRETVAAQTRKRKEGDRTIYELEIVQPNGNSRWLTVTASPQTDADGKHTGTFAIFRDITERKVYESHLIQAKEKAEESDRLKTSILSNISHELRTPLNGILGFSELLMEDLKDTEYLPMIENIHLSGHRLMSTLNSIITHSQLQAGKVTMVFRNTDLTAILKKLAETFQEEVEKKNLEFRLDLEEPVDAYTDLPLFQQLVHQLLDNAVKFTLKGSIQVSSKKVSKDGVHWQTICIRDTGIGIEQGFLDMIFDEFRQVSEGFDRKFQGSGLGLSICRKISDLLNGKITVESTVGEGTTFTIWLPVNPAEKRTAGPVEIPAPQIKPSEEKKKKPAPQVLIVEDNIINKNLIERFITPTYKMDHAINGKTAIRMAERKQYDAILMDINLGAGIDGIQTTKTIRTIKGYEYIPIIAVTGYTMIGDREKLLAEGCTHYIAKPFEKIAILNVLREALAGK